VLIFGFLTELSINLTMPSIKIF